MTTHHCDACVCPQPDFIDDALVQPDLLDRTNRPLVGTTCDPRMNVRTRKYFQYGILQWRMMYTEVLGRAADVLQRAILSRQQLQGFTRVPLAPEPFVAQENRDS